MTAIARTVVVATIALAWWVSGSGIAAASTGALGSDTRGSVITAGAAGLAIGGIIAFWQSRRNRRKDSRRDEPPTT